MTKCDRDYYPYYIDIPDFNCALHADDAFNGMRAARKRICAEIELLKRNGQNIPPSNFVIPTTHYADIITLVDVDTDEFHFEKKNRNFFKFLATDLT